jgi:hypothetical protein
MDIRIPETPTREIGKELSLNAMIDWFNNASKDIELDLYIQPDVLKTLDEYKKDSESTWSNGKYYLYGQIPLDCDVPITQNLLQSAIDENNKRFNEYGGPCNSFEAASIACSENRFTNLLKLLDFYYNKYDEIAYAPGGPGYIVAYNDWTNRHKS